MSITRPFVMKEWSYPPTYSEIIRTSRYHTLATELYIKKIEEEIDRKGSLRVHVYRENLNAHLKELNKVRKIFIARQLNDLDNI